MSSSAGLAAAKRRRASSSVKPVTSSNVSNNKVRLVKESEKAAALSRAPPIARVLYDRKEKLDYLYNTINELSEVLSFMQEQSHVTHMC